MSSRSAGPSCTPPSPRCRTRQHTILPTRNEIDEARARWREIAKADAGLGPIAAFHDERLGSLGSMPPPDVAIDLTAERAAEAIREGTPLLQAGAVAVETDAVEAELRRLARNLAETADLGSAAQRTAESLATLALDLEPVLGPALSAERSSVDRAARELGVDPDAFAQLLDLALQPVLWSAVERLSALTDIDKWERGYCPVCGAWPGLAELVGSEKRRVLRCVRCGVLWSWLVLLCPYCGNDDHRTLRVLQQAGEAARVDVCLRCHGYVKAVPSYTPSSPVLLAATDVTTMDLDLAASDAGYRRPGDVDARTAGIPRMVRERT